MYFVPLQYYVKQGTIFAPWFFRMAQIGRFASLWAQKKPATLAVPAIK